MRRLIIALPLLMTCYTLQLYGQELKWRVMPSPEFDMPASNYEEGKIYFFHKLYSKNTPEAFTENSQNLPFSDLGKPLDLYNYWDQKKEENYDVLLTKTAYLLNQPVTYFSNEQLSDPNYISSTMPSATLRITDSIYHIAMGFGSPDIDYTLSFYTNDSFQKSYPKLEPYFATYDGISIKPEQISVQHNFNYSRIMFQKTTKMSISISRYFSVNSNQTLVLNYTLNYIYNMPPELIGGSNYLLKKIKEGIDALVYETQGVCKKDNNP